MNDKRRQWVKRLSLWAGAVLCAVMVLLPAMCVHAEVSGTVTATSANIRENADAGSTALASVMKGDKLDIIEQVTGADGKIWYKVYIDANSQGYIRADLVEKGTGTVPTGSSGSNGGSTGTTTQGGSTQPAVNVSATINTDGVNEVQPVSATVKNDQVRVRADSSTNASIVTTVKKDVILTVHGTKDGSANDVWYLVSFIVNNEEVSGFIRSDFVTLDGELTAPVEAPADPAVGDTEPTEPSGNEPAYTASKDYETVNADGVWYLVDNNAGKQYQITKLLTSAEQNAIELENAKKKISKQNGIIIFLSILLVVLVLGATFLFFKWRDMQDEENFDEGPRRRAAEYRRKTEGSRTASPLGRTAGPAAARPAGQGQARPAGQGQARPAGQGQARPAGQGQARPAGQGQAKPATSASGTSADRVQKNQDELLDKITRETEEKLAREARVNAENREVERNAAAKPRQPKNFMADDEFEFEFLNWDGEEEP